MRVRLLPVTIGLMGLLLLSKSAALLLPYGPGRWALQGAVVPAAVAASTEPSHAAQGEKSPSTNKGEAGAKATSAKGAEAPGRPSAPAAAPPVSEEERQLLQDLRGRKQELEARTRALLQREGVLNAAEQRLVTRANELASLQTQLQQLEKSRADRDDTNWSSLVKVYEAMKPRDAALIFNDMDLPVLLQLTDRMREAKAAPILAAMQPDRARMLTTQLAAKRSRTTTMPDHAGSASTEGVSHS